MRRILSIELGVVQQRILAKAQPFVFKVADGGLDFLLREGADLKFGARHLKRSIERHLVYPLSNLIASHQVQTGDLVNVDFDPDRGALVFSKERARFQSAIGAGATPPSPPVGATVYSSIPESPGWFSTNRNNR